MTFDLPGLVRHVSRLMLVGSAICVVVALGTWFASSSSNHDEDAIIVLGTLAAIQAMLWFGLTVWADLAGEQA